MLYFIDVPNLGFVLSGLKAWQFQIVSAIIFFCRTNIPWCTFLKMATWTKEFTNFGYICQTIDKKIKTSPNYVRMLFREDICFENLIHFCLVAQLGINDAKFPFTASLGLGVLSSCLGWLTSHIFTSFYSVVHSEYSDR